MDRRLRVNCDHQDQRRGCQRAHHADCQNPGPRAQTPHGVAESISGREPSRCLCARFGLPPGPTSRSARPLSYFGCLPWSICLQPTSSGVPALDQLASGVEDSSTMDADSPKRLSPRRPWVDLDCTRWAPKAPNPQNAWSDNRDGVAVLVVAADRVVRGPRSPDRVHRVGVVAGRRCNVSGDRDIPGK